MRKEGKRVPLGARERVRRGLPLGGPERVTHGSWPKAPGTASPRELLPVISVSLRHAKGHLDQQRHKHSGGFVQQRKPSWLLGENLPVAEFQVLVRFPSAPWVLSQLFPRLPFQGAFVPQTWRSEPSCLLQAAFPHHSSLQESLLSPTGLGSAGSTCPGSPGQPEF